MVIFCKMLLFFFVFSQWALDLLLNWSYMHALNQMSSSLSVSLLHIWSNVLWCTREQIYDRRCLLDKSLHPLISHLDYNTNGTKYETRSHLPVNLTLHQHQFRCCTVNELTCFNDVTVLLAPGAGFTPATATTSSEYYHGASPQISIFRSKTMAASFYL